MSSSTTRPTEVHPLVAVSQKLQNTYAEQTRLVREASISRYLADKKAQDALESAD